jgi:hypothetical protein
VSLPYLYFCLRIGNWKIEHWGLHHWGLHHAKNNPTICWHEWDRVL